MLQLLRRLRHLFQHQRFEADLREEMDFHRDLVARDLEVRGVGRERASQAAKRAFGSVALAHDRATDVWVWPWLRDALTDFRFACRLLRTNPGFTFVAVITLALGIGANTAIFAVFNAMVLESLPVREPGRLILFSPSAGEGTRMSTPPPTGRWDLFSTEAYEFLRTQPLPFESLAAVRSGEDTVSVRITGGSREPGAAERAQAHLVSGTYFAFMGIDAAVGRTLSPDDDHLNAPPVAVVSDGFWATQLHASPAAIGAAMLVNNRAFTIVGVMPPEFFGERVRRAPDLWVPLAFQQAITLRPSMSNSAEYWLSLIGRLPAGTTRAQAQTLTTAAVQRFVTATDQESQAADQRRAIQETYVELVEGGNGISVVRQRYSEPLQMLLAVVGLVLLIACANVGSLLLARAVARQPEIAVRIAIGATRGRLIRQLFVESLVLAALGAAGAVLAGYWVVDALLALAVASTSPVRAHLDLPVLGFTLAVAIVAAIAFSLAPSVAVGRPMSSTRPRRGTLTEPLVVLQIAMSLVLLVGANLFARSLLNLEGQHLGFDQDHVLLVRLQTRLGGYTPSNVAPLYQRLQERLSAVPGVRRATVARYSPFGGSDSASGVDIEGYTPAPDENRNLEWIPVAPAYPETIGMPLLQGRSIGSQDVRGAPKVALVNQAFVRRFFPAGTALGHRFGFGVTSDRETSHDIEIVGVIGDARFHNATGPIAPMAFTALLQDESQFALDGEVEILAVGDPAALSNAVRQAIKEVDPNLPFNDPRPLRAQVLGTFGSQRLVARLVSVFGGLALILACIGLYGVVAQSVARRTSEIGLRMALGAQRRDIVQMMLRRTLWLLLIGLGLGVVAAAAAGRVISTQLYGLTAADPMSFAVAMAMLALVAIIAGLIPTRRAARVDPVIALRIE